MKYPLDEEREHERWLIEQAEVAYEEPPYVEPRLYGQPKRRWRWTPGSEPTGDPYWNGAA